jgi:hypothetical protein
LPDELPNAGMEFDDGRVISAIVRPRLERVVVDRDEELHGRLCRQIALQDRKSRGNVVGVFVFEVIGLPGLCR